MRAHPKNPVLTSLPSVSKLGQFCIAVAYESRIFFLGDTIQTEVSLLMSPKPS